MGKKSEERQSSIDVTSLWLSVEVNLPGDGCAYAIVCEFTGYTYMDLLFHCLTHCAAAAHRRNSEIMERLFLLSAKILLSKLMFSFFSLPNAECFRLDG